MSIVILITLFVMAVFIPRSKLLYWGIMVYMWLLFSLNTGAPDTSVYEWIYNEGMRDAFEPLFSAMMLFGRSVGLSFVEFRMVIATLLIFFLNLTFRKICQLKALAAAMYMIAPFPWQISGMRAALACAVVMYGFTFLFDGSKKNVRGYCIFLLIATLIHYSSILFGVMFLVKKNTTKIRIILFLIIAIMGILIVQHTNLLLNIVSHYTDREKIITWLSGGGEKEGYPNLKGFLAELIILFGNIYLTQKAKRIVGRHDSTGSQFRTAEIISDLNIITILFIPFLRLNDTYMRLIFVIHGINTVLYAMTAYILQKYSENVANASKVSLVYPRMKVGLYALAVSGWTYIIAFYQTLPYLGTPSSVFVFLGENSMFP